MSAKQLLPNQHLILHPIYGQQDCCLCRSERELAQARREIAEERRMEKAARLEAETALASVCDVLNQELRETHIQFKCSPDMKSMKVGIRAIVDRLRKAEIELSGASIARVVDRLREQGWHPCP